MSDFGRERKARDGQTGRKILLSKLLLRPSKFFQFKVLSMSRCHTGGYQFPNFDTLRGKSPWLKAADNLLEKTNTSQGILCSCEREDASRAMKQHRKDSKAVRATAMSPKRCFSPRLTYWRSSQARRLPGKPQDLGRDSSQELSLVNHNETGMRRSFYLGNLRGPKHFKSDLPG